MDVGEKIRTPAEKAVIINEENPLLCGQRSDRRIDLGLDPAEGFGVEREQTRRGNRRDGRQQDRRNLSASIPEFSKSRQDFLHIVPEPLRRGEIQIGPDIISSELKKNEIGSLRDETLHVLGQEVQVLAGSISAPAMI